MSTLARMHGKVAGGIAAASGAGRRRHVRRFGDGTAGYARQVDDWYVEEDAAVEALIAAERFAGAIHDPACGCGTIPRRFAAHGFTVSGADLRDRGYGAPHLDYLAAPAREYDNIVSNPPFKSGVVEPFILKALADARFKVAMLLRLAFLEGAERLATLYRRHPPVRVLVFSWRTSMPPGDVAVAREGGQMPFMWVVWERGYRGDPALRWI